jgi:hypothetical protein
MISPSNQLIPISPGRYGYPKMYKDKEQHSYGSKICIGICSDKILSHLSLLVNHGDTALFKCTARGCHTTIVKLSFEAPQ